MKKNYILDTNILLQDEKAFLKFEDNNVCIPIVVVDELDNLKGSRNAETAYNARCANRALKSLFADHSSKDCCIQLPGGGILSFPTAYHKEKLPNGLDPEKNDHKILLTALEEMAIHPSTPTVLVTNDAAMQVKARLMGIRVEDYKNIQIRNGYTGRRNICIPDELIDEFYACHGLESARVAYHLSTPLVTNEFVCMRSETGKSALARFDGEQLVPLRFQDAPFNDVTPRKNGQRFAKEALLNPDIPLVILKGIAGTAKTFLALTAGLQMLDAGDVRQILLLRPQSNFDEEIGYLPGDEQSKIDPLLRPYYDNLARILEIKDVNPREIGNVIEDYFASGMLRAEAFNFIQGRSITNSFIIIDEVQNATRLQVRGAITRAGENSKIVLCGDPDQVTNPRLDAYNNGLRYACEKMKGSPLCAQVTFENSECQRSRLAAAASELMN